MSYLKLFQITIFDFYDKENKMKYIYIKNRNIFIQKINFFYFLINK